VDENTTVAEILRKTRGKENGHLIGSDTTSSVLGPTSDARKITDLSKPLPRTPVTQTTDTQSATNLQVPQSAPPISTPTTNTTPTKSRVTGYNPAAVAAASAMRNGNGQTVIPKREKSLASGTAASFSYSTLGDQVAKILPNTDAAGAASASPSAGQQSAVPKGGSSEPGDKGKEDVARIAARVAASHTT
jgi:hypothetical protein